MRLVLIQLMRRTLDGSLLGSGNCLHDMDGDSIPMPMANVHESSRFAMDEGKRSPGVRSNEPDLEHRYHAPSASKNPLHDCGPVLVYGFPASIQLKLPLESSAEILQLGALFALSGPLERFVHLQNSTRMTHLEKY